MDALSGFLIGLNILLAAVYIQVGRVIMQHRPQGSGRLAGSSFGMWWFTFGILTAISITDHVVRHTVGWTLPSYLAYLQTILLLIVIALAALMYYMVYLFSGRRRAWIPVVALYGLYYASILYYLAYAQPMGVSQGAYSTSLEYAKDMDAHWATAVLGALLAGPPLVAAMGYFSLFFRVDERSQRFRIGAVAGAFIFWFGTSFVVGQLTDLGGTPGWRVASAALALTASWFVYITFRPPQWIKERFGIAGFGES